MSRCRKERFARKRLLRTGMVASFFVAVSIDTTDLKCYTMVIIKKRRNSKWQKA